MRRGPCLRVLSCLVALCLVVSSESAPPRIFEASDQSFPGQAGYPAASWALGVVAPEGAETAGGGTLHWEDVGNVTALVTLPTIRDPDLPVYAVLSLMTRDGSVLQVAAGVKANGTSWSTYADFDTNVDSVPPTYQQILNASQPQMPQGASISLSVFRSSSSSWFLKVVDLETGSSVKQSFPVPAAIELEPGDQEAFALESYSRNQTTFENMGSLTLSALLVDGRAVSGGLYSYGDWVPNRNPLFVVGSLGASPPLFVSLGLNGNTAAWSYFAQWADNGPSYSPTADVAFVLPLALALLVVVATGVLLLKTGRQTFRVEQEDSRPSSGMVDAPPDIAMTLAD